MSLGPKVPFKIGRADIVYNHGVGFSVDESGSAPTSWTIKRQAIQAMKYVARLADTKTLATMSK